jgi:hypothetical protein
MRLTRPTVLAFACLAALGVHPALAARFLAPHRAVYDLSLDKATDKSGITGISGRMVYEFSGSACEGYTVKFRFVTQIDTDESSRLTDQQTTTFEDPEGKTFNFVTKSFVDQTLDKEVKGTATRNPDGTTVKLEKPQPRTLSLARTQFPTQHLVELLGKAEKGDKFYQTTLFDGSEDADRVMTTTVVIGKERNAAENDPELPALASLKPDRYWPVTIAYFDTSGKGDQGEGLPTYRISFKLHDNGITRDLMMDYGDFSMKGKLVNLALFKPSREKCSQ